MSAETDLVACKDALLEAVLPNVVFDGWSPAAVRAGAERLGLDEAESLRLFPDGPGEVALWLDDWADRRMLEALGGLDLAGMKVRARVAAAVTARLQALAPHREAVRRAIALKLSPFGVARAARIVYRTVDAIWYAAGDTATDFNFYTKRSLLAAIYTPTMLYWLNDGSDGAADTLAFFDRRLADVMKLPGLGGRLKKAAGRATAPFDRLRRGRA
jgi:ubiquinone biosynthesis protein COQ9